MIVRIRDVRTSTRSSRRPRAAPRAARPASLARAGIIAATTVERMPTSSGPRTHSSTVSRSLVTGSSKPIEPEHQLDQLDEAEAAGDPEQRGEEADERRLGQHRAQDLARRGAERAQHRELLRPLHDGDRERVEDQEGADEHGDAGEDEQRGGEEREAFLDVAGVLGARSRCRSERRTSARAAAWTRWASSSGVTPVGRARRRSRRSGPPCRSGAAPPPA